MVDDAKAPGLPRCARNDGKGGLPRCARNDGIGASPTSSPRYQRLLIESLNATDRWEMQPAVGCGIDILDQRELVVTIEEAIRRGRMEDPGTRDPLGLLRGLGLLVQGDQISRAAMALFCKDDHSIPEFPQFNLRVARFKGTTRDEFLDNRQYSGNAFALMRRAERSSPQANCTLV